VLESFGVTPNEPLRMESIAQIHAILGLPEPAHPHLAVIAASWQEPIRITIPVVGRPIESGLYVVSLKRGDECHAEFGRQVCDGQAGTLAFLAPGQTLKPLEEKGDPSKQGDAWTLVFHPELLRGSSLSTVMHRYRFFGYAAREALHLTEAESEVLTGVVRRLEQEASVRPDPFAGEVLTAELQVLLSYCQRSYARQFQVRSTSGESIAAQLDRHLDEWLAPAGPRAQGLPSVQSCARALGYSADYLSDLLRTQTGQSARAHIQRALIEAAKARLLSSETRSSEVAYALGFEHPQHFTRLFRQKTGLSPSEWRRAQLSAPAAVPPASPARRPRASKL
jgi:AraC family transcriptional activator of pobA